MEPNQILCVTTTLPSKESADALADALVRKRLVACVQVQGPISSTYHWRGMLEHAEEWLCVVKTDGKHFDLLKTAILEQHTYDEPEIVATEIVAGSATYLAWLRQELA